MASVRLSLVTDMEVVAMFTEQLRGLLEAIMARGLLNLDMDTAQELATTTEVPREFKVMVMEVITRDLLNLDTTMAVKAISMSTGLILTTRLRFTTLRPTTMDMARGLLNLDMALLMSTLSKRIMVMDTQNLMNMATTSTRDLLMLDMAIAVKAISMSTGLILTTRLRFTTLRPTTMDMARGLLNP